ncbi:MAG TPA: phospholipase D-like domain-containing protein [Thermoanaerobaculia bacterium]|nr:phospholipase D-like domain-containing protein [Thermoanaerobaculia bacterium]
MHALLDDWVIILVTVIVTALGALLALNLTTPEERIQRRIDRLYAADSPMFRRSMGILLGPAILPGNRIEILLNGDEIFPAMLAAIRAAQKSITLETFIYWSADIGKQFAEALADKAKSGVKVHVLLDWLGCDKIDDSYVVKIRDAGGQVEKFHPLRWHNLGRLNDRNHRKVLVVDGSIGFTGGVGIAEEWTGRAQDAAHWRDSHFRVRGPVVAQMQAVFLDSWMKATGHVLHGDDYFPHLSSAGDGHAQMFSSSPSGGSESMHLMYLLAITAAERSILLANAYFLPDDLTCRTLIDALERGVRVRIMTPGKHIDESRVRRASHAGWGDLLRAGAEIYEYQRTMFHCKTMVIDDCMISVGSTNFDPRSFRLNDEANLNVYDPEAAAALSAVFEDDQLRCLLVTYESWRTRPLRMKLWEKADALIRSQL